MFFPNFTKILKIRILRKKNNFINRTEDLEVLDIFTKFERDPSRSFGRIGLKEKRLKKIS